MLFRLPAEACILVVVEARTRGLTANLLDLVFPDCCAGCGRRGAALCAACARRLLTSALARSVLDVGGFDLPLVSVSEADLARRCVAAMKDGGRFSMLPISGILFGRLLREVPRPVSAPGMLVPIPATRRSLRRRGCFPLGDMLACASIPSGLHLDGDLLAWTRHVLDQRALGRRERFANLRGALRVMGAPHGSGAVVIDDVTTSGATLRTACEALLEASVPVWGAVTLARVPFPGRVAGDAADE